MCSLNNVAHPPAATWQLLRRGQEGWQRHRSNPSSSPPFFAFPSFPLLLTACVLASVVVQYAGKLPYELGKARQCCCRATRQKTRKLRLLFPPSPSSDHFAHNHCSALLLLKNVLCCQVVKQYISNNGTLSPSVFSRRMASDALIIISPLLGILLQFISTKASSGDSSGI